MNGNGWIRKWHTATALVAGLPLVLWTLTGFAFTLFPFDLVRGERDRAEPAPLNVDDVRTTVESALRTSRAARRDVDPVQVHLRMLAARPTYVVELTRPHPPLLIDAATGEPFAIDERAAAAIASAAFVGSPGVDRVDPVDQPANENLGAPAFRVRMRDPLATEIFVDRGSGDVAAWRNDVYRRFDFLWSLHVFAKFNRDNPAQWPLRIASGWAALVALTGVGMLALAARARRRASHRAPAPLTVERTPSA